MKNNCHYFGWQASNVRGCEAVEEWIEPIRNHFWHCAEQCDGDEQTLSGSPAKSGPPVFATKNSFPLFCAHQKGLIHMS